MAIHAGLGRWNAGRGGSLYRGVAIAAVDAQLASVMAMAERHRLLPRHAGPGDVGGAVDQRHSPRQRGDDEQPTEDAEPRQSVRAPVKHLGHAQPIVPVRAGRAIWKVTKSTTGTQQPGLCY